MSSNSSTMQSNNNNDKSAISKLTKRVRFHERVEIKEIEDIKQLSSLIEEGSKQKAASTTKHASLRNDGSLESSTTRSNTSTTMASTASSSDLLSDELSLCSSSISYRSHSSRLPDPVQNPMKIPPMLFNMLPLPIETTSASGNNPDRRWEEINKNRFQSFSLFSLTAPVRAPSMDQIIDSALAVLEDNPIPTGATSLKRQCSDGLSDRKNDSWDVIGYDTISTSTNSTSTSTKERWRDYPQSPPKIPRRKISMDDVTTRKIEDHSR